MKKTIIIVGLAISLMSTKCAEERLNMVFNNKSERDIIFSQTKNMDSLKKIISKKYYHDSRFKYLNKKSLKTDTLVGSDLNFYLSKDKSFYTFYFLRIVRYDTLKNIYVFNGKYDSINISKEKVRLGEEGKNSIIYSEREILFISRLNN